MEEAKYYMIANLDGHIKFLEPMKTVWYRYVPNLSDYMLEHGIVVEITQTEYEKYFFGLQYSKLDYNE